MGENFKTQYISLPEMNFTLSITSMDIIATSFKDCQEYHKLRKAYQKSCTAFNFMAFDLTTNSKKKDSVMISLRKSSESSKLF